MGHATGINLYTNVSLDAFLELKLENEKLREELRELQSDFDEDDYRTSDHRFMLNPRADP